ncbi:MAG: SGNH/GDSL hydrolase family protein [Brevundimonas sp.]|uniref:SGNH/GDSL hydrolase family protein n=1 Tax=Brevundimonas sp. TaxID=1871086 RepID=UPI00403486EF
MTPGRWLALAAMALSTWVGAPALAQSTPTVWAPVWTASAAPARFDLADGVPLVHRDQTIRQDIRLGGSARALRFRVTNELGVAPLRLRAMTVTPAGGAAAPVTFSGDAEVVLPPGVSLVSDSLAISAPAFSRLTVTLHVPDEAAGVVRRTPMRLGPGSAPVGDTAPLDYRQGFLSAVYAERDAAPAVVVALGDSITEGATTTRGADADWPSLLADRLEALCPGGFVVVNAGISGNQVVRDGRSPNVRARLDRDLLSLPGVTHVVWIEGINDIRHDGNPMNPGRDPEEVIAAYRQVVARLHLHGIKVFGGSLTPFGGSERFDARSEASRQAINAFIRTSGVFDGVIDFDAALRDPNQPSRLVAGAHTDDRLHPNDEGHRRMAQAIDLALFDPERRSCGRRH